MTLARLQTILDAYGGDPARWPDAECAAALALIAQSPDARARHAEARRLDAALAAAPPAAPSDTLAEQIVSAMPERRGSRGWRIAVRLAPLAAAAAFVLWIVRPAPGPPPAALSAETIARLGVWEAPTDYILAGSGLTVVETMPAFGCDDDALGCLEPDTTPRSESRRASERIHA